MNYFKLFNLPEIFDINIAELNKNFYTLQKKFHPDLYIKNDTFTKDKKKKKIYIINEGYRNLKDPLKRINHIFMLNKLNFKDKKRYPVTFSVLEQQLKLNFELETLTSKVINKDKIISFIQRNNSLIQNLFKKISFNIMKKEWTLAVNLYQELKFLVRLTNNAEEIQKNKDFKKFY
ncbi:Fe-S protein assembly co-chaperone HscB [Buchnera aphidicola]|uniref:Fe-S protein assembly co-chaperone HscB n=1 Tax=Buchnera aphidicola TaxID=9 RepID=UPI003463E833